MSKIYYNLIKAGLWTIERVPQRWRNDVQTLLDADVVEVVPDVPSGETTTGSGIKG